MLTRLLATCLLVTVSYCCVAQRMDPGGSAIGISYTQLPTQPFKDTSGGFGYHALGINVSLPLFGNRHKVAGNILHGDKPHFYQVTGHAGLETLHAGIGFINDPRNFYTASAGLNGLFFNGKKDIIVANLSMGIASDGLAIQDNNIRYRFSGLFVVNHLQNASTSFQYGLVLNYAYGRPLPLPVLGIRKKFAKAWTFAAILPVSLQLTNRLNKKMNISLLLRPAGNRFQLQNQHNFATTSSTVYMQLRQFELGLSWLYRFAPQFSLGAEAGVLAGGKMKFTETSNIKTILYQTGMKPGSKFRLSLRYHLPIKKAAGDNLDTDSDLLRLN